MKAALIILALVGLTLATPTYDALAALFKVFYYYQF
jgi:hypothetical protein